MPRMTTSGSSAFTQVQAQAREALARLRTDIRAKDAELRRLRQEESKWAALIGQPGMVSADGGMAARGRGARTRINWGEVLISSPSNSRQVIFVEFGGCATNARPKSLPQSLAG